ncbi:MAG: calcium-binding protein [Desulfoprunum sp.]|nr:calcium-binding protein [Desulfoprunum sp.]
MVQLRQDSDGDHWYYRFFRRQADGTTTVDDRDFTLANIPSLDVTGSDGRDFLYGMHQSDTLTGGAGDDTIYGWDVRYQPGGNVQYPAYLPPATADMGGDILSGGAGNDYIIGSMGEDTIDGGEDDDILSGKEGTDYIFGGQGKDVLLGGDGNDVLQGGAGDDFLSGDSWAVLHYLVNGVPEIYEYVWVQPAGGIGWSYFSQMEFSYSEAGYPTGYYSNSFVPELRDNPEGQGNDYLTGGMGNDFIYGMGGDDTLFGEDDNDTLAGGAGNDYLSGGAGNDRLMGDNRDNTGSGNDTLSGGSGNDQLVGGLGGDTLYGGEGNDILMGDNGDYTGTGSDYLYGDAGDDALQGGNGNDQLDGGVGDDRLYGDNGDFTGTGNDTLHGGAGNDQLVGGLGDDILYGDEDNDKLMGDNGDFTGTGNDILYGGAGDDELQGGNGDDQLDGGVGDDRLYGDNGDFTGTGNDILYGGAGIDQLVGGLGDDTLYGGAGKDQLAGGMGDDTLYGSEDDDLLWGDNGDFTGTGNDTLFGGTGNDGLQGGNGNDQLDGGDGDDFLWGDNGDPTGSGDDTLLGGAGKDQLVGGMGDDILFGDEDDDKLMGDNGDFSGSGNDTLHGGAGDDELQGGNGNDQLNGGDGDDRLWGDNGDNTGSGNDTLYGGAGDDTLQGTGGDDNLYGEEDADMLSGDDGNDLLDGGAGEDEMYGGSGDDNYVVDVGSYVVDIIEGIVILGGDIVSENVNEGIDTVQSSVAYTLGANVENLVLTGDSAINATGNSTDNVLTGNSGGNTLSGGAGNDTLNGGAGTDALVGGLGNDKYVVDNVGDSVTENANQGADTVQSSITYTLGANVENLTLTGTAALNGMGNDLANMLTGNSGENTLTSGAGNDTLDGGAGADALIGGLGNDIYIVDNAGDSTTETANQGTDTVQSSITYTLNANVENLTLTGIAALNGTGNGMANVLSGNNGENTLFGEAGNDTLNGGAGADILFGGIGDDTYLVDNVSDIVTESASQGIDTVQASVTYTLAANVENLSLTGTSAINGTGNSLYNTISGTSGANTLDGGTGADNLLGGLGNDIYVIDNTGDIVIENTNQGVDTVQSSITYTLGANIENLTLTSTTAINGTGNTLDNVLTGNSSINTLMGGAGNDTLNGGAGADILLGGIGNDTYVFDDTDIITENVAEGIDTVQSSLAYTLTANLENLTLTGTSAINGTGNELDNVLTGNSGVNTLMGEAGNDTLDGGAGTDTLLGGVGNDTYVFDGTDVIVENVGEGIDTVQASLAYTLGANFENLTLTGTAALNGTGNELDNVLTGNSGVNTLTGGAGNDRLDGKAGVDTMRGGTGDDTYVVSVSTDVIVENANEGIDTVESAITLTLANNVEILQLTGTATIRGTGNTLNNVLIGNSAANTLDGGTGADTLVGGLGDDIYIIDNTGDIITENVTEGTDTAQSSISYTLATNIENITLTGASAINGTGNSLDNVLTGNSGVNTLSGGAGNDTLNGGSGADQMFGGTGDDIYVADGTDVIAENADEGIDTVQSGIAYTLGANVENLILTGTSAINGMGNSLDNVLTGNSGVNTLSGGAGNDTLNGGSGADQMFGGTGNDIYVADGTDVITENAGEGIDTVQSGIAYTLGANVENLTLTGAVAINGKGNSIDNVLTGNSGKNTLTGGAGNDRLDGKAGADTMQGGVGDDIYCIDILTDIIVENANEGIDTVLSDVTYTLGANVENLILTGTSAYNGTGNELNNVLIGNDIANILDGRAGSDTMSGGMGHDIYIADNDGDIVAENANEGIDSVQSSATYALSVNVENLTLMGTSAINGTGNSLDNVLTGNSGENILTGGAGNDILNGGSSADQMFGGTGDDIYVVDGTDVIAENSDEGIDTVQSGIAYTLGANVENLTLTGTSAINGTGNSLDNILIGNSGANTLTGGAGNDTYRVDNLTDIVMEVIGEGIDTVQSSITYSLGANVENLTLMGAYNNIDGTGNDLNNTLIGNTGNNRLDGGAGADTLTGGDGSDRYIVDNTGDIVIENVNGGLDSVQSSITYILGVNVEGLSLTGNAALNGTGNDLENMMYGNAGYNTLTGLAGNDFLNGGLGGDVMLGGTGNDTYIVDSLGDAVIENSNEGTDKVESSVTYTLSAHVENLTLTGASGNGTGNGLNNTIIGNTNGNWLNGLEGADTMDGGDGNDTYVVDNFGDVVIERGNFKSGFDWVYSSVSYTLGAFVESLTLTGSADINGTGNGLRRNYIKGNSGNNILTGGSGDDFLNGGTGDDTYVVKNMDHVTENTGEGTDTVESSNNFVLGANLENLTLTGTAALNGTGNDLANVLTGNSGVNTLTGGAGNDTLNGGAGADHLIGGIGNDIYVIDSTDVITENAGEGSDTVQSSITYTLSANFENLVLTDTSAINGTGNELNNEIIGNSANNTLTGEVGNDTLNGGEGNDILVGGTGNDIYVVDSAGDVVSENVNEGIDTVKSSFSYILGANLESLTLTGSLSINGTGNDLDNCIIGNSASNTLHGGVGSDYLRGGGGDDVMYGGTDNDTYVVDSLGDVVSEDANEGIDTVESFISYALGATLENLTLLDGADIDGTGNNLDNILFGNAGNNTLNGGVGSDTMNGAMGYDNYVVDSAGDVIIEEDDSYYDEYENIITQGIDNVESSVTFTLSANVENLTLTGVAAIDGTGNTLDNALKGNNGGNTLAGGAGNDILNGGLGNDTLAGGAGNNFFVFDTALNATTNKDSISDFTTGLDKIQVDKSIFTSLVTEGTLLSAYFKSSTTGIAGDANDYFLYNTSSGALLYDADGNGQGVAVQFATLTTKPAITANDFLVTA